VILQGKTDEEAGKGVKSGRLAQTKNLLT